ncbi:MAGa3780 family membrane protein [Mycoplasma leonicaptivi]|uniref:MAGa3780 family membrane protein n=1 Tax=Mycoplasma leonicaptivi TaxID=36742 RepID=UPI0006877FCB|nr:hypothetical protein [Mycoplasma leonicaptivi]
MKKIKKYFEDFKWNNWTTLSIGVVIISLFITTILWEWYDKSVLVKQIYSDQSLLDKINEIAQTKQSDKEKLQIYDALLPNATRIFWGGSTYWFTFISNNIMGFSILFLPFFKKHKLAQKMYLSGIVFIILVLTGFWGGVWLDKNVTENMSNNDFHRTLIWHGYAPFLGICTIFYERKNIKVSTSAIWCFCIFPVLYMFFMFAIYANGYKFMHLQKENISQLNWREIYKDNPIPNEFNTELSRGIVIYSMVSIAHPFGYQGDSTFVRIFLNCCLVLMMIFSAPVVGFILRKILRIQHKEDIKIPKLILIANDSPFKRYKNKNKYYPEHFFNNKEQ